MFPFLFFFFLIEKIKNANGENWGASKIDVARYYEVNRKLKDSVL